MDRWFELHAFEPGTQGYQRDYDADYLVFLASLKCHVEMIEAKPLQVPKSRAYPKAEMLAEFGPYFFTSTVSFMFAQAIMERPDEIGLFGIDMAAQTEYAQQRPGCQYFIQIAEQRGIRVSAPPESDILEPPPLYGFCEVLPMYKRLMARRAELKSQFDVFEGQRANGAHRANVLAGAIDDIDYTLRTYGGRS